MALVDYDLDGHVAIITLNRPEARNAINPEVAVRLADAWESVRADDNVRVAVLTGTGSAFCAGADLGQLIPMMSGAR
ncbi:MAG: enoyl-CoA hydratase/isomerase family protein, partial [Pseudomonadales bacterium]